MVDIEDPDIVQIAARSWLFSGVATDSLLENRRPYTPRLVLVVILAGPDLQYLSFEHLATGNIETKAGASKSKAWG